MIKRKILIIDDEAQMVDTVKIILEMAGYEVVTAYNGEEGLERAFRDNPDMILLDISMPGMDGFEVLSQLRNNPQTKYTKVIMFTCKGDSQSLFKAMDLKATDYVIKPFDAEELLGLIKKYIK